VLVSLFLFKKKKRFGLLILCLYLTLYLSSESLPFVVRK